MITLRAKLLWAGTGVILIGFAALLISARRLTVGPKQWLVVSTPVFANRMTTTGAVPTVSLTISNAGPRTIDPGLSWFECRSKAGLAGSEDNAGWGWFAPLSARRASKVACDLPQGFSIGEDSLFCCEVTWFERGSAVRRLAQWLAGSDHPYIRPWNIDWMRPWQSKPLTNGVAFASNVAVASYFRSVYGLDEASYERAMLEIKPTSVVSTNKAERKYGNFPTREEQFKLSAWRHYETFRKSP